MYQALFPPPPHESLGTRLGSTLHMELLLELCDISSVDSNQLFLFRTQTLHLPRISKLYGSDSGILAHLLYVCIYVCMYVCMYGVIPTLSIPTLSIPTSSIPIWSTSHFVNSHFVNSHLVNVDKAGIDKGGIDEVGS